MYDISNIFKRCIEEKIKIVTGRSSRADRSQLNSSMMVSRVKAKDNQYSCNESNSINKYDVELACQTELEYNPRFLIKNKEKIEVLSDCFEYYELPKISPLDQQQIKKYSMCNSQHDSQGLRSRKNTYQKYRQFQNRLKTTKVGYLSLDPESPFIQEIFKQLCSSSIYQEITKPQVCYHQYLVSQLPCQSIRLLGHHIKINQPNVDAIFNYLSSVSIVFAPNQGDELAMYQIFTIIEIIQLVFSCYDVLSKTYLNTRDLFELFKSGGAAQRDADIIFKYLRCQGIRRTIEMNTTISTKMRGKQRPQKQMVITMMKEKARNLSEMYNRKQTHDKNIVTETTFLEIFQNTIPELFKSLVQLLANYNCD
ncbi:unnamed protein product (macronuclear) [Paramecium tetraurelia]|uniref:Uncharacterized protein n=1 Tax=Paramecium tetraurelia TaxID=5888 RepID=A0BUN9_PARTE|nr:uncharacterized protein GSPATT00005502001 [Paramecium tetraurelia]CAK62256.1 unnamed protein product [Paramecium tetraurelia]|eukprot:XP_001429654.1 hypothetical protein (macronuclear) [Paramecium tetraurelia strain d4-2]